jgi:outer membrane biosynthesis protein TonB
LERPGPALIGSVLVHAGVVAAVLGIGVFAPKAAPRPIASAVPVSIVSDVVIAAAPADNPSPELVTEDATTAPVAPPPEPVPAPPEPKPVPPPLPTPTPVKKAPTPPRPTPPRPTPPRPTPPRTQPPRPTPPRPTPPRREETLDLDALAGPPRPATRPGTRPATGQQGQGQASQATGPQVTAIFNQVYPNWILPCDIPGARDLRIQMDVTLDRNGRITSGPTLIGAQNDPVWRAAADGAMRALRQSAPFDVPQGFQGGSWRPSFNTERACRNR